jgi:hypothetical protein
MQAIVQYGEDYDLQVQASFDRKDFWNFDQTIAAVILRGVQAFQAESMKKGTPFVDNSDVPPELASDKGWCDKKWQYVLDEIIWSMGQVSCLKPDEEPFDFAGENWSERSQEYHKRVQKGCILFGKYLQSMWT